MNTGEFKPGETSILVTGETGFIAHNFIRLTVFRNCRKTSLRNKNVLDLDLTGIDVVLHLAALVHDEKGDEESYSNINRNLTVNLAEIAKKSGVRHFIFMSTAKVYGDGSDDVVYTENSECNPTDFYGKSKLEAELLLRELNDENFCVSIIRTPVVYGKGMKANMLMLQNLIKYFPILPLGGINNKRCYTYIGNLSKYIDRLIEMRIPGVFIVMDSEPISTTYLVRIMSKGMHRKVFLFAIPDPVKTILRLLSKNNFGRLYNSFILDNSRTRKLLSLEPFSTEEGISRMIHEI